MTKPPKLDPAFIAMVQRMLATPPQPNKFGRTSANKIEFVRKPVKKKAASKRARARKP